MIDDIMMYWLTNSATSSARLYWENADLAFYAVDIDIPVGVTIFPGEIYRAPKSWAGRCYHQLVYWNEVGKGGHFAAFEQPELFAQEVRSAFGVFRRVPPFPHAVSYARNRRNECFETAIRIMTIIEMPQPR